MLAELRAAIRADPDDFGARAVYADYLIQHGDPRGEWIALHAVKSDEAELKRRALWQVHGAAWLAADLGAGPFDSLNRAHYRGGFLEDARFEQERLVELAPALAVHPVRNLSVRRIEDVGALAALPVLATCERLALGAGLHAGSADELLAVLEATPRLKSLELSRQSKDAPFVWDALARFSRLAELEELVVWPGIELPTKRAAWLANALPELDALRLYNGVTDATLAAIAEHATFELQSLDLSDRDMTDHGLAAILTSPFVRGLVRLSLDDGQGGAEVANALTRLPCAAHLTDLGLGQMGNASSVYALGSAELPMLRRLSVRDNGLGNRDLAVLARFPTLTALRAEGNAIGSRGVRTILDATQNLDRLWLEHNPLDNEGVIAIGYSDRIAKLRYLFLSRTYCSLPGVHALVDGGKLTELRTLELAHNTIFQSGVIALATGPFDKLGHLNVSHTVADDLAPLFAGAWLQSEQGYEGCFQRRLASDGTAVPYGSAP